MFSPKGISILVIKATVVFFACSPMATIFFANVSASSFLFIKAPLPQVTSNNILSLPAASFLLITDAAIKGILSTVSVTSRNAYNFLSAGAKLADCPTTLSPMSFTI